MNARVTALFRHPVKGLSPEPLPRLDLAPGQPVPGDRRFAIISGSTAGTAPPTGWVPKSACLTLATHPRLAELTTRWIDAATTLTIERKGRQVARGDLGTALGRGMIGDFVAAFLKERSPLPRVVEVPGVSFSDAPEPLVSIVSAASLRDLERVAGRALDVRRFRANVVVDGLDAWAETAWPGKTLSLGPVRLEVVEATTRCTAPNANPDTGVDDVNILRLLQSAFGHVTFGVYARVIEGGAVETGSPVDAPPPPKDTPPPISFFRDLGVR